MIDIAQIEREARAEVESVVAAKIRESVQRVAEHEVSRAETEVQEAHESVRAAAQQLETAEQSLRDLRSEVSRLLGDAEAPQG